MTRTKGAREYSVEERMQMLKLRQKGLTYAKIAAMFHVPRSGVFYAVTNTLKRNSPCSAKRSGAPIKFTNAMFHDIDMQEKRGRHMSLEEMKQHIQDMYSVRLSLSTIAQVLRKKGFFPYHLTMKPLVTEEQRKKRVKFARQYRHEDDTFWENVVFTDETSIDRVLPSRKRVVWLRKGNPLLEAHTKPTAKFGGGHVSLWMAITRHGVLDYTFYENDLSSKTYVKILKKNLVKKSHDHFGDKPWIFQQDNDPAHTAVNTHDALDHLEACFNFSTMQWPSGSPDLSPIENYFGVLKKELSDMGPAKTLDELRDRIDEKIEILNREENKWYFQNLYNSMPHRMQAVIAAKGGPIPY